MERQQDSTDLDVGSVSLMGMTSGMKHRVLVGSFKGPQAIRGFTLMELMVVISITLILSGISYTILSRLLRTGQESVCLQKLARIGHAVHMYVIDNDDRVPPYANSYPLSVADPMGQLRATLTPFGIKNEHMWQCPLAFPGWDENHSFGLDFMKGNYEVPAITVGNYFLGANGFEPPRMSDIHHPSEEVYLSDSSFQKKMASSPVTTPHGENRGNCLYFDLHVKTTTHPP